ncbi:MAG: hypothetical protein U0K80_01810 [Methanobrevibacter sp.]|nr:hypothetical protein [Methanobrevibacter sp.]
MLILKCFANDFIKDIVIIAAAITQITLAIIEGNFKHSGDCSTYPNVIKIQIWGS